MTKPKLKLARISRPRGDPDLINCLIVALDTARKGKLQAAAVVMIVDSNKGSTASTFVGGKGVHNEHHYAILGMLETCKHNMMAVKLDNVCENYADHGDYDPAS